MEWFALILIYDWINRVLDIIVNHANTNKTL
jgi:hypothetical protein